ncbi:MAG: CsgG/HfaB family protein [Pseudomonadota bacterium]
MSIRFVFAVALTAAVLSAACHTTPIPYPPVPPISVAPTPMPGPFDYSDQSLVSQKMLRKRLAVARFDDNIPVKDSPFGHKEQVDVVGPGIQIHREAILPEENFVPSQFTEKLLDALSRTQRFVLIERKDINALLREVSFGDTRWVDKNKSAKLGKILGAQIIITGAMSLNDLTESRATQPLLLLLRMYDVETSRIVGTARATGKTLQEVIDLAVGQIVQTMDSVPWTGKIASVTGAKLYLNAGSQENVQLGDRFNLFSLGKPLTDPDSKEVIGYEEEPAGKAEVTSVAERVATLKILDQARPLKVGDKAQPMNPVPAQ